VKRYITTLDFKAWNQKHARSSQKKNLRFKEYLKRKRQAMQGRPANAAALDYKYRGYLRIKAPTIFSFVKNTDEVIGFISNLEHLMEKRKRVFIILRHVSEFHYDGIVVLLSVMIRFKAMGIKFAGDYPDDPTAKAVLEGSGFFDNLHRDFKATDRYKVRQTKSIVTHAWKQVDSALSSEIIEEATRFITGEPIRCQGVQRVLIELMHNTNNHANPNLQGERHWWLSVHHDRSSKKVAFSFVDYGVGVFRSLRSKKPGAKFFGVIERMADRIRHGSNEDIMRLILNGELHRTASGKAYRGKGLPGIKDALDRGQIQNLSIITNDVKAHVDSEAYSVIPNEFSGTFIHWEISRENLTKVAA